MSLLLLQPRDACFCLCLTLLECDVIDDTAAIVTRRSTHCNVHNLLALVVVLVLVGLVLVLACLVLALVLILVALVHVLVVWSLSLSLWFWSFFLSLWV